MMMMMNMMMKIKMVITRLIFKLGAPNFARQYIQIIPTDDDNDHVEDDVDYDDIDDDDEHDDEDQNGHNSANFELGAPNFAR